VRRRWWWLVAIGVPVALVLVLYYAPVVRYRPSCGGAAVRYYFDGPMRDVFVDQMTEGMRRDKFPYVRIGNELFIQFFDPDDFLINTDWRIASSIGSGFGPGDTRITPPPALLALVEKAKDIIEHDPSMSEEEKKRKAWTLFGGDCELIRAAAIRIEDMKPEELLRYVPKSPLPPKCTPYNMRGWRRDCGRVVHGDVVQR
jgi:hypothetical protein